MNKQSFKVLGMNCAACSARLEKVISALPGIESANVNLATEKLTVEYDGSAATDTNIRQAV